MSNVFGKNLTLSIFGESHGQAIGMVIGGLPAGVLLDFEEIGRHMRRRVPGQGGYSTPRSEKDVPRVVSGLKDGYTTGAPMCVLIENKDTRSRDYDEMPARPSHADYAAHQKYRGYAERIGGGHFSGRLTAGLVFAGSVARQILSRQNIEIGAHLVRIGEVSAEGFDKAGITPRQLWDVTHIGFPAQGEATVLSMLAQIDRAARGQNSVGGVIECAAAGVPAGLGEPFFDSLESVLSQLLFSIPAIKGVEFGEGFALGSMRGADSNDPMMVKDTKVVHSTNHMGGINGGITNGAPVVFRVVVKPTSTIGLDQRSVSLPAGAGKIPEDAVCQGKGRHDPCIAPRAVPVVESALAIALLEMLMRQNAKEMEGQVWKG